MITKIFIGDKELHREEYQGDFDKLILGNIDEKSIENFSADNLGMINIQKYRCGCDASDFDTEDLIEEVKERGHQVIECQTLADTFKLDKLKEQMQIS